MAKQTEKPIVAGLLLFFFIGLVAVAVQFMQNPPQAPEPPKAEGFASAAPTRATDCSCLPGYVPSNKKSDSRHGGIFYDTGPTSIPPWFIYVPDDSPNSYYGINSNSPNQCGIDLRTLIPRSRYLNNNSLAALNLRPIGAFNCDMLKKSDSISPTFFCQSLSNPADIKQCY